MTDKALTDIAFSNFDITPALLDGLEQAGFSRCTPIQAMTLPFALSGRDVAGQAQTGTGKTLAFLIACMNRLLTKPAHCWSREHWRAGAACQSAHHVYRPPVYAIQRTRRPVARHPETRPAK